MTYTERFQAEKARSGEDDYCKGETDGAFGDRPQQKYISDENYWDGYQKGLRSFYLLSQRRSQA